MTTTPPSSDCWDAGSAIFETDLNLPDARRGKVRDVYALPGHEGSSDRVLMVASDRISAFDVVLPEPMAGKGKLLTAISAFWLRWIEDQGVCRTHLLSTDPADVPEAAFTGTTTRTDLGGRIMIGRACRVIPVECVVRGYLEGSGWSDYQRTGTVCGIELPTGLRQCERLPEPIFTPATKADIGAHDENIGFDAASAIAGRSTMERLRNVSLAVYNAACEHAAKRGIIIADTKFEFGVPLDDPDGEPILIDEALTPDSSRFWPADAYEPGQAQASYDKQFVREYLEGLVDRGVWDKTAPGPSLPAEVIAGTLSRYREAATLLTS